MTEKEYREHPALSRSELWVMKDSPEKFKYQKENPAKPTQALVFGQFFHELVLQPEKLQEDFTETGLGRRSKAFAELQEKESRTVITSEEAELASAMKDACTSVKMVRSLLNSEHEKEFFWTDEFTQLDCKCRADIFKPDYNSGTCIIGDLKTARSAKPEEFMREAYKLGYHFQAAYYSEGVKAVTGLNPVFVFVVVEKEPPYATVVYKASDDFILAGQDEMRDILGLYRYCSDNDEWFGYQGARNEIIDLELPAWAKDNV